MSTLNTSTRNQKTGLHVNEIGAVSIINNINTYKLYLKLNFYINKSIKLSFLNTLLLY